MRVQAQPGRGPFADLRRTAFSLERASFGLGGLSLDIKGPSARPSVLLWSGRTFVDLRVTSIGLRGPFICLRGPFVGLKLKPPP